MKIFLKKPFLILFAILALALVFSFLFHLHEDGRHALDCALCKLARQVAAFFVLAFVFLVENPVRRFFGSFLSNLNPLSLTAHLQARAPPIVS